MTTLVITNKKHEPSYQIRPYGKGSALCFEVYRWHPGGMNERGKMVRPGWKSTGKYAISLEDGIRIVAEDIEKNGDIELFTDLSKKGLEKAAVKFKTALQGFKASPA